MVLASILKKDKLTSEEFDFLVKEFFEKENNLSFVGDNEDLFWILLRKHVIPRFKEKKRFEFFHFKFPSISPYRNTFWEKDDRNSRVFEFPVYFDSCKFFGEILFDATFKDKVSFNSTIFYDEVNFHGTKFTGSAEFMGTKFLSFSDFQETNFQSIVLFCWTKFNGAKFYHTHFSENNLAEFSYVDFDSDKKNTFENCTGLGISMSSFSSPLAITFVRIDFTNSKFYNCDLSKVKFLNCTWPGYTRLKLADESTFFNITHGGHENTYRELKNNFESNKEWDLARMAFRSEMYFKLLKKGHELLKLPFKINGNTETGSVKYKILIRRNKIRNWIKQSMAYKVISRLISFFKSKTANFFKLFSIIINYTIQKIILFFEVLILLFYSVFSGQTYSITRPIIWFIVFTVFLFPFIYSGYSYNQFLTDECIKESVNNAFPFSKFDDSSSFFYVKLLQKVLSVVLITFFVIALRRRFKN